MINKATHEYGKEWIYHNNITIENIFFEIKKNKEFKVKLGPRLLLPNNEYPEDY